MDIDTRLPDVTEASKTDVANGAISSENGTTNEDKFVNFSPFPFSRETENIPDIKNKKKVTQAVTRQPRLSNVHSKRSVFTISKEPPFLTSQLKIVGNSVNVIRLSAEVEVRSDDCTKRCQVLPKADKPGDDTTEHHYIIQGKGTDGIGVNGSPPIGHVNGPYMTESEVHDISSKQERERQKETGPDDEQQTINDSNCNDSLPKSALRESIKEQNLADDSHSSKFNAKHVNKPTQRNHQEYTIDTIDQYDAGIKETPSQLSDKEITNANANTTNNKCDPPTHYSNSHTQTEGPPLSASVDVHTWERNRLARNGWGMRGSYTQLASGETHNIQLVDQYTRIYLRKQRREAKRGLRTYHDKTQNQVGPIGPVVQNPTETFTASANNKLIIGNGVHPNDLISPNINTQFDKATLSSELNQVEETKVYGNESHCANQDNEDYNSHAGTSKSTENLELNNDGSSIFDSTPTTPRAVDRSSEELNSSRSLSIASDSGTSLSIPSDVINNAKPYTDRTKRDAVKAAAVEMADVTSPNSLKSEDSDLNDPVAEPTLKVEYVTKVWDAYITDFLISSEHIKDAAIFDRASASCIACSLGFVIDANEYEQLQLSLSSLTEATRNGVTLQGRQFKTVLADGRRGLMAKRNDRSGCSACQTRTLILVAVHDHTGKPARCNEEVMRLGDFFWAKGL